VQQEKALTCIDILINGLHYIQNYSDSDKKTPVIYTLKIILAPRRKTKMWSSVALRQYGRRQIEKFRVCFRGGERADKN
jgi:hypothetical protein